MPNTQKPSSTPTHHPLLSHTHSISSYQSLSSNINRITYTPQHSLLLPSLSPSLPSNSPSLSLFLPPPYTLPLSHPHNALLLSDIITPKFLSTAAPSTRPPPPPHLPPHLHCLAAPAMIWRLLERSWTSGLHRSRPYRLPAQAPLTHTYTHTTHTHPCIRGY